MSTDHTQSHHLTAEERIEWGKILAVGVGALLAFALSIGFAVSILHGGQRQIEKAHGLSVVPKAVPAEVGIINQRLFVQDPRAAITRDAQLAYLHSYGWVDRKAGVIHIPIQQAMEALLAQKGAGQQK